MKPILRRSLTHLACAVIGVAVAAAIGTAIRPAGAEFPPAPAAGHSRTGGPATGPDPESRGVRPAETALKSKDYRNAWNAIARRNLTARQRLEMQKRVLREWAKIDLEAALAATLECSWKDDDAEAGGARALIHVFAEAFSKDPLESWQILQSGRLGPGASLFRWWWISTVSAGNPLLVLSLFDEFPPGSRASAFAPLLHRHKDNPEVIAAMLKMLGQLPADNISKSLAIEFYKFVPPSETAAELGARFAADTSPQEKQLALQALAAALRTADIATIQGELGKLPAEIRNEITRNLLNSPKLSASPTALLDLAMQAGNWEVFRDPRVAGVNGTMAAYAKTTDPIALAEWGLNLPNRPETQEVFRRSVGAYIHQDYTGAREWISTLPAEDFRRDRALAEYSQNALWYKNDPAGSEWAIGQIQDDKIKGTVINWRKEWTVKSGIK